MSWTIFQMLGLEKHILCFAKYFPHHFKPLCISKEILPTCPDLFTPKSSKCHFEKASIWCLKTPKAFFLRLSSCNQSVLFGHTKKFRFCLGNRLLKALLCVSKTFFSLLETFPVSHLSFLLFSSSSALNYISFVNNILYCYFFAFYWSSVRMALSVLSRPVISLIHFLL